LIVKRQPLGFQRALPPDTDDKKKLSLRADIKATLQSCLPLELNQLLLLLSKKEVISHY
jgi:hypothetical protein